MTVDEIVQEVYENIGEPTFLSPYNGVGELDSSTRGYQTILRWINQAIRAIAAWKDRVTGRQFRYTPFITEQYVRPFAQTYQVTNVSSTTEVYSTCTDPLVVGMTFAYGRESSPIVASVGGVLTLAKPLRTAPSVGESHEVRASYVRVDFGENLVEVLKVVDETLGVELEKAPKGELFHTTRHTLGIPSQWVRMGTYVYFNVTPSGDSWYRVSCYALPPLVIGGEGRSGLPPQYDQAIVLYATGLGFLRMQEMTAKYSIMQDFEEYMRRTQSQEDVQGRLENGVQWIMED